jgi:hypothetical protein
MSMVFALRYSSARLLPALSTHFTCVPSSEVVLQPAEALEDEAGRRVVGVVEPQLLEGQRRLRARGRAWEAGGAGAGELEEMASLDHGNSAGIQE